MYVIIIVAYVNDEANLLYVQVMQMYVYTYIWFGCAHVAITSAA
jgi:hypothetical protein